MDGGSQLCDGPTSRPTTGRPAVGGWGAARWYNSGPPPHHGWPAGGWPAGWPITYLATPIRFGGILCILYII